MLLSHGPTQALGGSGGQRLRFGEANKPDGSWRGRRLLLLDERPAFELSFWCGTCPFLFRRLEGANSKVSLAALEARLAQGVEDLDDEVIAQFSKLLPASEYLPLLLHIEPRLVLPVKPGDYFSEEQVATWGVDSFWGLPEYPQTPYYRTFETAVNAEAHLFEFVVPMVPPSWNDPARVAAHRERLQVSSRPTAVAISTLDVCQPADSDESREYFAHWALTHFLLDGHHKLQAAAEAGKPLQLLTLLSLGDSLAAAEQIHRVPELRGQEPGRRATTTAVASR